MKSRPSSLAGTHMYPARETWLTEGGYELIERVFGPAGIEVPPFRVSVGWPSGRGANALKVIGQTWYSAADGMCQVFISPMIADPVRALDILTHEMGHVIAGGKAGHGPAFKRIMKAVGLEGKPTATVAGAELTATLEEIVSALGAYPHVELSPDATTTRKKQTTRMMKAECPVCGYTVRVSRKWLEEAGAPICPTDLDPMDAEVPDGD